MLIFATALAAETVSASSSPAAPVIEARWKAGIASIVVTAAPGEHVNVNAPALLANGADELRGSGALAWARIPAVGTLRAELPFCTDDGRTCRTVVAEAAVSGTSGKARLTPVIATASGATAKAHVVRPATAPPVGAAVRLIEFGAVWCPPCNQMKAEVLDDPADSAALAPYTIEVIDADLPESWALKTRHTIGGYPTLLAVDAQGNEVDRYLGYVSEADLLAWIAALPSRVPMTALRSGDAQVDPAEAALRLARGGDIEAAKLWLAKAKPGTTPFHEAHLLIDPAPADADFLLANAPSGDWLYEVISRWPDRWPKAAPRVASLDASLAAACLQAYADGAAPDVALVARVSAAALVRTRLATDPAAAKGHVLERADLLAQVGDLAGALALLDAYEVLFPGEFTFDFTASRLLFEAGRHGDSEARARDALTTAWGDQRLRTVVRLAKALDAQGKRADAIAALNAELAAAPRPGGDTKVRTSRYIGETEKLLAELTGK
jgi:thiol-disulfide isomerase/thioredoxin